MVLHSKDGKILWKQPKCQLNLPHPSWACFSLKEEKATDRKTPKQAVTEGDCSKETLKKSQGRKLSLWWCTVH